MDNGGEISLRRSVKKLRRGLYTSYTLPKKDNRSSVWEQLIDLYKRLFMSRDKKSDKLWTFRGQKKIRIKGEEWDFCSSLERGFEEFQPGRGYTPEKLEQGLIREFKRKLHIYESYVPEEEDTLEWLALMRHHGVPTRLLDWTYSFYFAIYFAVKWGETNCEVWALDAKWFSDEAKKGINKKDIKKHERKLEKAMGIPFYEADVHRNAFVNYLMEEGNSKSLVVSVNPIRLNERLAIQQGVFLFPGDVNKSFVENFNSYSNEAKNHLYRINLKLSVEERNVILKELYRMNINEAVLFPGIDGFARSLRSRLAIPETLKV